MTSCFVVDIVECTGFSVSSSQQFIDITRWSLCRHCAILRLFLSASATEVFWHSGTLQIGLGLLLLLLLLIPRLLTALPHKLQLPHNLSLNRWLIKLITDYNLLVKKKRPPPREICYQTYSWELSNSVKQRWLNASDTLMSRGPFIHILRDHCLFFERIIVLTSYMQLYKLKFNKWCHVLSWMTLADIP